MTARELRDSPLSALVLGTMVTLLRERHRMSQTELAERLGLTQSTISRLERGQTEPEPALVVGMAKAFELDHAVFARLRESAIARTATAVATTMTQAQGQAWWEAALDRVGFLGMAGLVVYVVAAVLADVQPQNTKAASSPSRAPRVHGRSARPGPRHS